MQLIDNNFQNILEKLQNKSQIINRKLLNKQSG